MGVKGLWQLLDSTGRPITLESLENKVLAVDVSIWLNQAIKGYRDREGRPVQDSHLLALFQRVSKLLFYRIKPVFVFDGEAPQLKKQTLAIRRKRKQEAYEESNKANKKILSNYLASHIIGNQLDQKTANEALINSILPQNKRKKQEEDIFNIPEAARNNNDSSDDDASDEWEQIQQYRDAVMGHEYQNLNNVDYNSEHFKSLPAEIRYSFLKDMKDMKQSRSLSRKQDMPEVAQDFSEFQLKKLLKKRVLQNEIEIVEKEMKSQSSGDAYHQLLEDGKGESGSSSIVNESRRVASDELTHVILIRKDKHVQISKKTQQEQKAEKVERIIGHRREISNKVTELQVADPRVESKGGSCTSTEMDDVFQIDEVSCHMSESSDSDEGVTPAVKHSPVTETLNETIDDEVAAAMSSPTDAEIDTMTADTVKTFTSTVKSEIDEKTIYDTDNDEKLAASLLEEKSEVADVKSLNVPSLDDKTSKESLIDESCSDSSYGDFLEVLDDVKSKQSDDSHHEIAMLEDERTQPSSSVAAAVDSSTPSCTVVIDDEMAESSDEKNIPEHLLETAKYSVEELKLKKASMEAENVKLEQERARQERIAMSVTDSMAAECQELLKLFGVPYLVSPMEAEAQCAKLNQLELTEGTISDDSDIWLFGGQHVYKNFFNQKKYVELFQHADIQSLLKLNREKMIHIAMLTGSDYTEGIEGVGPVTAMEILAEFPGQGLGPLLNFKDWWQRSQKMTTAPGNKIRAKLKMLSLSKEFPSQAVFNAYMDPQVDDSKEKFSWSMPDLDQLRHYALERFGWNKTKVDNLLLPIFKKINSTQNQLTLDSYLSFSLKKDKNTSPSKRLQRVLDRVGSTTETAQVNKKQTKSQDMKARFPATKNSKALKRKFQLSSESNKNEKAKVGKPSTSDQSNKTEEIKNKVKGKIVGLSEANAMLQQKKRQPNRRSKSKAKLKCANVNYLSSDDSDSD